MTERFNFGLVSLTITNVSMPLQHLNIHGEYSWLKTRIRLSIGMSILSLIVCYLQLHTHSE